VKELSLGLVATLGAIAGANSATAQTTLPVPDAPLPKSTESPAFTEISPPPVPPTSVGVAPTPTPAAMEFSTAIPINVPPPESTAAVPDTAIAPGPTPLAASPDRATPEYSAAVRTPDRAPGTPRSLKMVPPRPAVQSLPLSTQSIVVPPAALPPLQPTNLAQQPDPIAVPAAPAVESFPTPEDRIQLLEKQQEQLKQQIEALKQQVSTPAVNTVQVPDETTGELTFSTEVLFLRPHVSSGMDFAIVDPGVALSTSGQLSNVEFQQSEALRFALNYRLPRSAWDLGVIYTTYDTRGSSTAARPGFPDNPNTPGFLFSTLTVPFQNDRADTAIANADLEYDTTDLEMGYRFRIGKGLQTRLFGGWRFGNLDRDLSVAYNGQTFRNAQVNISDDFKGSGPRLGAELRLPLGSGFSVFGRGAASILFGKSSTRFQETNVDGTALIADLQSEVKQTVPVLDMAVGLDWNTHLNAAKTSSLSLSAGYEYQHWFNAVNNTRFVNASNPGAFAENQGDLSLQGFFLKAGLSFTF
jgi:hypothetical protein